MVYTRSGKVLQARSTNTSRDAKRQQPSTDKKRKSQTQDKHNAPANKKSKKQAEEVSPAEENKENAARPSTPPPAASKAKVEHEQQERTPGRVGPIKNLPSPGSPGIRPFKGPPGKKVRKTWWEKEEEYTQFIRDNEGHTFHELHVCFDKGPNGSPTYDKSGFELDYKKVAQWMKPTAYNKSSMINGMERSIEKLYADKRRMADIFFEKGEAPADPEHCQGDDHWKDRVSKDLNIPWHKIGVEHFEEWEKRGFKKARRGEYETFSEEERKRFLRLLSGASLRK